MNDIGQLSHQLCTIFCKALNQESIDLVKELFTNNYCDCNILFIKYKNSQDTPLTLLTRKLRIENEKIVNNIIVEMFGLFSKHKSIKLANLKRISNVFASVIYQFEVMPTRNKATTDATAKQNEYGDCCVRVLTLLKDKFIETFDSRNINVWKYIIINFIMKNYHYLWQLR